MRSILAAVALLILGSTAGVVLADTPPVWRGEPATTLQRWDFTGNSATPSPDVLVNPYGTPSLSVDYNFPFGTGWYNTQAGYGSKQGFWDIANGSMSLNIPSVAVPAFYLQIQLQVTYWLDVSQAPTFLLAPSAVQIGPTITTLVEDPAGLGAWYSDLIVWEVTPGPSSQAITLLGNASFGSVIEQVIIDTRPVPEPTTFALFGISAGIALFRRWFRSKPQ